MSKKHLTPLVIIVSILAVSASLFVLHEKRTSQNAATQNQTISTQKETDSPNIEDQSLKTDDNQETFVTDIDMDINHWQIKKTEYFTVKFPKEWYWLESDLEKTGYHSRIITNNPHFDIDKYADISVFTGDSYKISFKDNSEIIITMNGLGDATSNSGTPREFMEGEIAMLKKDYPEMKCHYTSSLTSVPLTAFCASLDSNGEVVDTYYSSNIKRTFAYTARLTQENGMRDSMEYILEQITKSRVQEKNF